MVMGYESKGSLKPKFNIGKTKLECVEEYCYLGIVLNKSGSLKEAQSTLKSKAMSALFGFKSTVNKSHISFRALITLFDSLIKPIVSYGAPIWLPTLSIIKILTSSIDKIGNSHKNFKLSNHLSRLYSENVHISFLRWALGVHKKSSLIGIWGETGRYPLIYQQIKLTLKYFERINKMKPGPLVQAALYEQKSMLLPWYKVIEKLQKNR